MKVVGDSGSKPLVPVVRWLGVTGLVLASFVAGLAADRSGWHRDVLGRLQGLVARIEASSRREQLPTVTLDMGFPDYSVLLAQREAALLNGVYLSTASGFVPAVLRLGNDAIEVQLQLLEGPSDGLGVDDKWPLDVQVTSEVPPDELPFRSFVLKDPAENNWLMQWAFAETLRLEGFLVPRYAFVRLVLNGDYRGIYAVQEILDEAFLASQGRPPGVIVGYDSSALWESVAHFGGSREAALADPVSNLSMHDFRAFGFETAQYEALGDLQGLESQVAEATARLYALQTGQRKPSELFDVDAYGRLLALVDLWGAAEATSLINLRYYYNPGSGALEPIVTDANPLSSHDRLALAATYGDPRLQMAYVQQAAQISDEDHLAFLEENLMPTWLRLASAMEDELPDLDPPWPILADRQRMLRQSLRPVQPVFAYLLPGTGSDFNILSVDVANRLSLPIEVLGFDVGGATFVDAGPGQVAVTSSEVLPDLGQGVVLRAAGRGQTDVVRYTRFRLPLDTIRAVDSEATFDQEMSIRVAIRLLGAADTQFVPATTGIAQPLSPQTRR